MFIDEECSNVVWKQLIILDQYQVFCVCVCAQPLPSPELLGCSRPHWPAAVPRQTLLLQQPPQEWVHLPFLPCTMGLEMLSAFAHL